MSLWRRASRASAVPEIELKEIPRLCCSLGPGRRWSSDEKPLQLRLTLLQGRLVDLDLMESATDFGILLSIHTTVLIEFYRFVCHGRLHAFLCHHPQGSDITGSRSNAGRQQTRDHPPIGEGSPAARTGEALAVCCLWIIPSTLIQDFVRSACPPSAAVRALSRATVAACAPCTSIMSRASDSSSAPSGMIIISSIAASGEAPFSQVNSLEPSKHDECRQDQPDQDRNDNWRSDPGSHHARPPSGISG